MFPGMTSAVDTCWGGYYCPPGQYEPQPADYICPLGLHCPNGSEVYQVGTEDTVKVLNILLIFQVCTEYAVKVLNILSRYLTYCKYMR